MLNQVQIHPNPTISNKEKGDFFEYLLRSIMDRQRYDINSRIRFTGTEIDLLCQHKDRPSETALVECKARTNITSDDIKNFCFDVIISNKAKIGFFVHTSEIKGEAAGLISELKETHPERLYFWGPEKVIELLEDCGLISKCGHSLQSNDLNPTKRILLYTYRGHFWATVYTNKIVPTHYIVSNTSLDEGPINLETMGWISEIDEFRNLQRIDVKSITSVKKQTVSLDTIAEIQEAE